MKLRPMRQQDHTVLTAAFVLIALSLAAINALWPKLFVVTIAIGGVLGAFMVLYDVRTSKRLAEATFMRELQTGFTENDGIQKVWRKLLRGEEITADDRPDVSSYLTFFETLHLLLDNRTLQLKLCDDLFRNRFFTAVGDPGIQVTALVKDKHSFTNIHRLISMWHDYLLHHHIPMHDGFYAYVRGLTAAKGFEVRQLDTQDFPALKNLQTKVLGELADGGHKDWLRENDDEMLKDCLQGPQHYVLGAFNGSDLAAAAVLFDGGLGDENIRHYLPHDTAALTTAVNLKLVLRSKDYASSKLGRALVELLEQVAQQQLKKSEIWCTIHPGNGASQRLFTYLGYKHVKTTRTSYGMRGVYVRRLAQPARQWAR